MTPTEVRAGRPRDPSRDEAILAATVELLGEVGYEEVTVRAIAQRSGTGLATLYRRWPTKEQLVVDAVSTTFSLPVADISQGGDPIDNVVRIAGVMADMLQGPHRRLIPNLLGQIAANSELAEVLRSRIIRPRLDAVTTQLLAVPGVGKARAEELAAMVPGWVIVQSLFLGRQLKRAEIRHMVESLVAGAMRGDG